MIDLEALRGVLLVFGLSLTRLTAACSVTPFMARQLIPGQARNSIIVAWGLIVYPIVAPTFALEDSSMIVIVGIVAKEIFLGILIGFMASKMFWIAMSVGFFIDNQRGASMASVFDPTAGEQTSPVGQFLQQAMVAVFYSAGGLLVFLGGVFESYLIWPIDSFYPTINQAFPMFFLDMVDDVMRTIVVLAAPAIIAMFLATFGLGLMNRFAPQLNVFFLAMPVKSMIALIVLILYLPYLLLLLQKEYANPEVLYELFRI